MKKPLKQLTLNQHHTVSNVLCGVGFGCYLIDLALPGENIAFLLIALGLLLGGLIYALIFMRCPYCGSSLINYGRFRKLPIHCADCGKRIDYNATEE